MVLGFAIEALVAVDLVTLAAVDLVALEAGASFFLELETGSRKIDTKWFPDVRGCGIGIFILFHSLFLGGTNHGVSRG